MKNNGIFFLGYEKEILDDIATEADAVWELFELDATSSSFTFTSDSSRHL